MQHSKLITSMTPIKECEEQELSSPYPFHTLVKDNSSHENLELQTYLVENECSESDSESQIS